MLLETRKTKNFEGKEEIKLMLNHLSIPVIIKDIYYNPLIT